MTHRCAIIVKEDTGRIRSLPKTGTEGARTFAAHRSVMQISMDCPAAPPAALRMPRGSSGVGRPAGAAPAT